MKILFITLILCFSSVFAFSPGIPSDSIEWQRIKLQEKIENKINRSIKPIVKDFIIEINFNLKENIGEDLSNKSKSKKKEKRKLKFFEPTDNPSEDYVIFNKLGLEAPIYGEEGAESGQSEVEFAQKAIVELRRKYNLFSYLDGIDITIFLGDTIKEENRKIIEEIVNNFQFSFRDIVPSIEVKYIKMAFIKDKPKKKDPPKKVKKPPTPIKRDLEYWLNLMSRFGTALGLIFAAFMVGLFGLLIFKKWEKSEKSGDDSNQSITMTSDEKEDENGGQDSPFPSMLGDDGNKNLTHLDGLERFSFLFKNSEHQCLLIIKKWLSEARKTQVQALKLVVEELENDFLIEVFSKLSTEERVEWKRLISFTNLKATDKPFIKDYIGDEVISSILSPQVVEDYQLSELLLKLSPQMAIDLFKQEKKFAAFFSNVVSATFLKSYFDLLEPSFVNQVIEDASEMTMDEIKSLVPEVKVKIEQNLGSKRFVPFNDKVLDLLPEARMENEEVLFGTYLKNTIEFDEFLETAIKFYPQALILNFSDEIFQQVISTFDREEMAKYFISRGDQMNQELDRYALNGTKARDMIGLEIEKINEDQALVAQILENKEVIWKKFVAKSRQLIQSDKDLQSELRPELLSWSENLRSKNGLDNNQAMVA